MSEIIFPSLNAITLFFIVFTITSSWVAIIIVFPLRCNSSSRCIISTAFALSRFPVGSSHMIRRGSWINARAIQVLCISPPERVSINLSFFARSPTYESTSGTFCKISWLWYQHTSIANATFSLTVFRGRSLKSWKIVPILRRYASSSFGENEAISFHLSSKIWPLFSFLAQRSDFIKLVFPLPEAPIRKINSPGSIFSDTFLNIVRSP